MDKVTRKDMNVPIKDRAESEKYNVALADSSQDYGVLSVVEAYKKGAQDQEKIDKWKAQEAFCKVVCPFNQCEVALCEKVDKFIKQLGGW